MIKGPRQINKGIVINAVCPGMVDTSMTMRMTNNYDPEIVKRMISQAPIGRFGRPEEIASAVVWLCSPGASFTIGHVMAAFSLDRAPAIRDVSFTSNRSKRPAGPRGERAKLEALKRALGGLGKQGQLRHPEPRPLFSTIIGVSCAGRKALIRITGLQTSDGKRKEDHVEYTKSRFERLCESG